MAPRIHTVDLHFRNEAHAVAAYIVEGPQGLVLIETGPRSTLDTLLHAIAELGYQRGDIRDVLVTHIHLDHAGALGWWAEQGAQVYLHDFGVKHVVDPSKLIASATRLYGDEMDTLWGEITPVPQDKITALNDGDQIQVAGLELTAIDSPGHARHHMVFRLGDVAFTGDAAGVRLLGSPYIDLPAPPPEFHREVWFATLDRLRAERFTTLYPTHFGAVNDAETHLENFRELLDQSVELVHSYFDRGLSRDEMIEAYLDHHRQRAVDLGIEAQFFDGYAKANPLFLSVDGIRRYLVKQGRVPPP